MKSLQERFFLGVFHMTLLPCYYVVPLAGVRIVTLLR
jgi:hypothetical protein